MFLVGGGTHGAGCGRHVGDEMGFEVVGMGGDKREQGRRLRGVDKDFGVEPLVTDDCLEVERRIEERAPGLILGTQMERHIGKRLGIPCAVISAPVHVQDFPARYSPQMGIEGANVIFDTWVHPLVMGLEEHLLTMFRQDFEFHDEAGASHHGHKAKLREVGAETETVTPQPMQANTGPVEIVWLPAAEKELKKIPFFVRGKAKRNTENYAHERGVNQIGVDTLYEAKAHYAR